MKQLRRLSTATTSDPFQIGQHGLVRSFTLSEDAFRAIERERPDHVVVDGDALLTCQPNGVVLNLHYAFPDRDAFARQFPQMLQRLLPAADDEAAPLGFRLRLTDRTNRPYLEPVLFSQAFELDREWMEMNLAGLPDNDSPVDTIAGGYELRPARPEDATSLAELDTAAFPTPALKQSAVLGLVPQAPLYLLRLLIEPASGRVVGFLQLRSDSPDVGNVSDLAVHPELQRRGLGEAMMRWAFAWFRQEGLRRATLTVSVANGPAISLYRKLGFTAGDIGLDYRRPIDEDEVRQVLEKHRAVHIRIRRR